MFELRTQTGERVSVTFSDGLSYPIDDEALVTRSRDFFGRAVSVISSPPPDAQIDEVWHRELKAGAEPYLAKPSQVVDGEEMIAGGTSMGRDGNLLNLKPVHIVTTSSIQALSEASPDSHIAVERFRPNILVEMEGSGFPEVAWPGQLAHIGPVEMQVKVLVPRCVATILAHGDLAYEPSVLQTITQANPVDLFDNGTMYVCAGVDAKVLRAGEINLGDPVTIGD